jgi:8-oxo-dGTP diphosphatase
VTGPGEVRVAVDVVVLALAESDDVTGGVPVFLAVQRDHPPFADAQALPGRFLAADAGLEAVAGQILRDSLAAAEHGGEQVRHLEQLATFGRPDRDPRGRVLSVSYLALLPRPVPVTARAAWERALAPPALAFDHTEILQAALARLRGKLSYSTVAYGLLPDTFTLTELQAVYESVLARPVDKRNFRKKVLSLALVEETGELRRGPHRPAQLYRFTSQGLVLLDDVIT